MYDDWGDGYTASVESWGYTMPKKVAESVAKHAAWWRSTPDPTKPVAVLDAGAGDDLSGIELTAV